MNTLKSPKTYLLGVFALLLLPAQPSFAQTIKELKTDVSIIGQYDDNIFLEENNEQSDYLIKVRPGFDFKLLSEHTELGLKYTPTFLRYVQYNETEIRHNGTLSFKQDLSEHFRFYLNDIFIYSDEALGLENVTDGRVGGDRRNRENYMINMAKAELSYLFGHGDTLVFGYNDRRLRNDDDREDDGTILKPYASIAYYIDIRNQLEIEYGYTKARFWTGGNFFSRDDYSGHDPKITYFYNFTPHTKGALGYRYTTRDFSGHDPLDPLLEEADYKVHDVLVDFEHSFSPDFSIAAGAGYFVQKRELSGVQKRMLSDDQSGPSYSLSFTKSFERGSIDIGGSGGWTENDLLSRSDNRGFSKYWSAEASGRYQILNRLSGHARLYYRHDTNDDYDIKWEKIRGNCGLSWVLLPRISLKLDYVYNDRNDDIPTRSYTDQRVSLTLHYSKPSKW